MSALASFQNDDFQSLAIWKDDQGREYFRAIDVCSNLRHSNPNQALQRHVDSDYLIKIDDGTNRGGLTNYLSEPGLYQLIFASKTEWAKKFQRWVFEEVLPKIRSQGYYATEAVQEEMALILELLRMFNVHLDKVERVRSTGVDLTTLEQAFDSLAKLDKRKFNWYQQSKLIMLEIFSWVDPDCGDEHCMSVSSYRIRLTSAIERMQQFLGIDQLPGVKTDSVAWSGFDDERLQINAVENLQIASTKSDKVPTNGTLEIEAHKDFNAIKKGILYFLNLQSRDWEYLTSMCGCSKLRLFRKDFVGLVADWMAYNSEILVHQHSSRSKKMYKKLQEDIQAGLDSGDSTPLDIQAIKDEARDQRNRGNAK